MPSKYKKKSERNESEASQMKNPSTKNEIKIHRNGKIYVQNMRLYFKNLFELDDLPLYIRHESPKTPKNNEEEDE